LIAAILVAAALIGMYFRAEVAAYVTRYTGQQRAEDLANELAEARRNIDQLNLKLRVAAAETAQSLGQERAARQELTASTVQHRHALEEERARSAALASEFATARREIETQAALFSKAGDEAVQVKQAAESAMAELQQSLQQERDRAEALASELTMARRAVEQKPAAVEERPGVSLPAWANSDAFVTPAQTANQPDGAPEYSNPAIKPVETVPLPRERVMSADVGYCSQRYRSDLASGTYTGYDGRRHSCRTPDDGDCSQRYRSYDLASGTYTGYDGRRHSCR
jgi:hypothetical protein